MGEPATAEETATERTSRRRWTVAVFGYVALVGAVLQMRGAVVPTLRTTFRTPEWQLGLVAPAGTVGFLLMVTVVGAIAGRLDTRRLLGIGVGGTAVGVALMAVVPSFPLFLVALGWQGLFTGVGRGADRPLLSHLYPTRRGRLFGYYDMMWAVGATLGPALVAAAIALGNWRYAFGLVAAAFLPLGALVWRLPAPSVAGGDEPLDRAAFRGIVREPAVLVMSLGLFLSVGIEGGLFTWLTTYAGTQLDGPLATASLSVMLAGYVPGRFLAGRLTERLGYAPLAVGLVATAIPAYAFTFLVAEGAVVLVGVFFVGLTVSGFYPTLLAYATEAVPEHSAPVNAVAAVAGGVGIAAVPASMGFVIGDAGVTRAMTLLALPLGGLLVVTVGAWLVVGEPE